MIQSPQYFAALWLLLLISVALASGKQWQSIWTESEQQAAAVVNQDSNDGDNELVIKQPHTMPVRLMMRYRKEADKLDKKSSQQGTRPYVRF